MFNRLRLTFGSNTALALLGVDTQRLNATWRRGCQEIAIAQGMSSKELAVSMLFQMPRSEVNWPVADSVISQWVHDGKIKADFVARAQLDGAVLRANSGR